MGDEVQQLRDLGLEREGLFLAHGVLCGYSGNGGDQLWAAVKLFKAGDASAPRREFFDVSRRVSAPGGAAGLQPVVTVRFMRIELPPASWADAAQRSEDDAHTLTVEPPAASDWVQWHWQAQPERAVRIEVSAAEPQTLTLTF